MKLLVVSRRAARLLVFHLVAAVSSAQRAFSAGTVRVRKAPQAIDVLWTCSLTDGCIPSFECIDSTGLETRSKQSEFSADDCAQSGARISSEEMCELYRPVFLSDCSHSFRCCHIGIGSSLQQKIHPRYRIATFIQLDPAKKGNGKSKRSRCRFSERILLEGRMPKRLGKVLLEKKVVHHHGSTTKEEIVVVIESVIVGILRIANV